MSLKHKIPCSALAPDRRGALADQVAPTQPPRTAHACQVEVGTSLEELVEQAAYGHADAAQHLIRLLLEEDPQALQAVVRSPGPQLLERVLEWQALGTWADQRLAFPDDVHEPYARAKIRSVFLPGTGGSGTYGQQVLCAGLHDPRAQVRAKAAQVLGLLGEPAAAEALEEALQDSTKGVRLQAVKALGRLHLPQSAPALVKALLLTMKRWQARYDWPCSSLDEERFQLCCKAHTVLIPGSAGRCFVRWESCMRYRGSLRWWTGWQTAITRWPGWQRERYPRPASRPLPPSCACW